MLADMVSDRLVYRAADRLITKFGREALSEVNQLICQAVKRRDREQALLMIRIRLAIKVLHAPRCGPLH